MVVSGSGVSLGPLSVRGREVTYSANKPATSVDSRTSQTVRMGERQDKSGSGSKRRAQGVAAAPASF